MKKFNAHLKELTGTELHSVTGGRTVAGYTNGDMLIWQNDDDKKSRESLEAAGLEVVVAAATTE